MEILDDPMFGYYVDSAIEHDNLGPVYKHYPESTKFIYKYLERKYLMDVDFADKVRGMATKSIEFQVMFEKLNALSRPSEIVLPDEQD